MIREDVSLVMDYVNDNGEDSLPEMINTIEEAQNFLDEALEGEDDIEVSDKVDTEELKKELMESYNDIKEITKTPEINNLPKYIKLFKNKIEDLSKLLESDPSNSKVKIQIESLTGRVKLLESITSMERILSFNSYGKFKEKKFNKYMEEAYVKMDNSKLEFINPEVTYRILLNYYDDELKAKTIMMKFLMYTVWENKETMINVYFTQVILNNINNEKLENRKEILENLDKLYYR